LVNALKGSRTARPYILAYEPGKSKTRVVLDNKARDAPKLPSSNTSEQRLKRKHRFPWQKKKTGLKGRALLALSETASSRDVLQAIIQVAHLRALPYRPDLTAEQAYVWALKESENLAKRDIDVFTKKLSNQGWHQGRVLLNSAERAPYSVDSVPALVEALEAAVKSSDGKRA